MGRSNIILDFMDPENRILYGSYKNLSVNEHVRLLKESLNLAALICDDYCILPPCAFFQCSIARRALMEKMYFFDEGIIKFPLRESSIDAYIEKKRKNYLLDKSDDDYFEFFNEDGPSFFREHASEIIKRETKVGDAIASMVEATSFEHPLWKNLKKIFPLSILEQIRSAPRKLIEHDEAISVKAIKRVCELEKYNDIDFEIGRILQNKYFYIYIYEYDSKIISNIPPKTTDFMIESFGTSYDFLFWKFLLRSLGILEVILKSGSKVITFIRDLPNCYDFVNTAIEIGELTGDIKKSKKLISNVVRIMYDKYGKHFFPKISILSDEDEITDEFLESVNNLFFTFIEAYSEYCNKHSSSNSFHLDEMNNDNNNELNVLLNDNVLENLKQQLNPCDYEKPFVFIGYNRNDMELIVYNDCIFLGKMGVNYWIDNANMYGSNQNDSGWKTVVSKALNSCSIYLPYISPLFFDSQPCCEEVKNFLEFNEEAGIIILLKSNFSVDQVITRILTYDNILQGEDANNMIKLFRANVSLSNKKHYIIDQLYRQCSTSPFEHYINDSLFYNTFFRYGVIDREKYPNYKAWHDEGIKLLGELKC